MAEPVRHVVHLAIAEAGKVALLDGDYPEALRQLREAIRLAVSSRAPEIFFRHYTQCVLEALELSGDHAEVIAMCREADAFYQTVEREAPLLAKDHGSILERLGIALLQSDERADAKDALDRAVSRAGPGVLPLAEAVAGWLARGFAVPPTQLRQAQRRFNYFVVREDTVDRRRARAVPPEAANADPRRLFAG